MNLSNEQLRRDTRQQIIALNIVSERKFTRLLKQSYKDLNVKTIEDTAQNFYMSLSVLMRREDERRTKLRELIVTYFATFSKNPIDLREAVT